MIQQPQDTDTLDSPNHAKSHRVFANDDNAPDKAIIIDANGAMGVGAIHQLNSVENQSKLFQTEDILSDYVITGLLPATSSNLTSDISAGKAYVMGVRVVKTAVSHTYTASKDTYVDINSTGAYTFTEVDNGATAPAVATDSIRLAKVATDADNITSVTDLRTLNKEIDATNNLAIMNGNVGIGTTEPAVGLQVNSATGFRISHPVAPTDYFTDFVEQYDAQYPFYIAVHCYGQPFGIKNGLGGSYATSYIGGYYGVALTTGNGDAPDIGNVRMFITKDGNVGIGITSPTAKLQIVAGTASIAPLKLTAGVNLTTPEIGAIEFTDDGTDGHMYITMNISGVLTRREIKFV